MPDENDLLIQNWLYKSDRALKATKNLLNTDDLEAAQNRLYYSIFYTVSALAQSKGFITSKHGQLIGWFNREFVKTGIITKEKARIYKIAFKYRQESDYEPDFIPNKELLETLLTEAIELIEEIKHYLSV